VNKILNSVIGGGKNFWNEALKRETARMVEANHVQFSGGIGMIDDIHISKGEPNIGIPFFFFFEFHVHYCEYRCN